MWEKIFHTLLGGWSHVLSSCGNVYSVCMTTKQATSCCMPSHCPTSIFPQGEGFGVWSGSALFEAAGGEQRHKRLLQHIKI